MSDSRRGTIIYAACREEFAVLMADRLFHASGKEGLYGNKIIRHPRLPLAIAMGGFRELPCGATLVATHLNEILGEITDAAGLTIESVAARIESQLGTLAHDANLSEPEEIRWKCRSSFFIALYANGRIHLGKLTLPADKPFETGEREYLGMPAHVDWYFRNNYSGRESRDTYLGTNLDELAPLLDRMIAFMKEGISIDHTATLSGTRECDWPIDIAVVHEGGVHVRTIENPTSEN